MFTSTAMQNYLRGIEYPTSKANLIEVAHNNDAPEDVLNALQDIREGEYFNLADLMREIEDLEVSSEETDEIE